MYISTYVILHNLLQLHFLGSLNDLIYPGSDFVAHIIFLSLMFPGQGPC